MQLNSVLEEFKFGIRPILKEMGAVIVEITLKKTKGIFALNLLVDKPGGITAGECARLNKRISRFIEEKEFAVGGYSVEVSSPGLDRPLKEVRDFKRLEGKIIDIWLSEPVDGQNFISGNIQRTGKEDVNILDMKNRRFTIKYTIIDKAKLKID
jgi:ribosome maturation factor RimP